MNLTGLLDHYSIIIITDALGHILSINKKSHELTGFTEKELKGKPIWAVLASVEEQDAFRKQFDKLIFLKSSCQNDTMIKSREGEHLPIAWSSSCHLNEEGEVENVIFVGIDVGERTEALRLVKSLIDSSQDSILLTDLEGKILESNAIAAENYRTPLKELKGKNVFELLPEDLRQSRRAHYLRATVSKQSFAFEEVLNGIELENHICPVQDFNGNVVQMSFFSRNVSDLKEAQKALNVYMDIVDENVITSRTDKHGMITYVSKAFCRVSGYTEDELLGRPHNIVRHDDMPKAVYKELWKTISVGKVWHGEIKNKAKAGHYYWVDVTIHPMFDGEGEITGYSAIRQDITDRKFIEKLSITDSLTSLYNRRHFEKFFEDEIRRAKRNHKVFCFLMLDVDYFKNYNDRYGHKMGDEVLQSIAKALKQSMKRSGDAAYRLGGEEFGAVFTVRSPQDSYKLAEQIRIDIQNLKIEHKDNLDYGVVTASFGLVTVDFSSSDKNLCSQQALYQAADCLLYQAKSKGRNNVAFEEVESIGNECS